MGEEFGADDPNALGCMQVQALRVTIEIRGMFKYTLPAEASDFASQSRQAVFG